MDLTLFSVFLGLSLIIIIIGFYRTEHTELPLVGFFFLFLLALLLVNGQVEHVVGTETNMTYTYDNDTLVSTQEHSYDLYDTIRADSALSHTIGYYLAVAAAVGFIGVLLGLRRGKHNAT